LTDWRAVSGETFNFETGQKHYEIYRWKIERPSSNNLVRLWAEIGDASLPDDTKVRLADVAWALGSFERAYDVLMADMTRAERAHNEGVPEPMVILSGPWGEDSLDLLFGMGLWLDLGDALVAYRTIEDRLEKAMTNRGVLRDPSTRWTKADVDRQLDQLRARTLPGLGTEKVTKMADVVLHHSWDPSAQPEMSFTVAWKGPNNETVDFAEDDVREDLRRLVEDTLTQVYGFIRAQL
jgi:hypothetical protein